jgi:Holliday junction resolvasome RuvABC endonuclease subunit
VLPFEYTPSNCVIGIDPGVKGAIAFLDTARWTLGVIDMPTISLTRNGKERNEPATNAIAEIIAEVHPILVCSEQLHNFGFHPNPDDLMKMGRWRGQIEGIVAASKVGFEHPTPSVWKGKMGLTAEKELSRLRANKLFPGCASIWKYKKDHDRAEAALIALYGCLTLGIQPTKAITAIPIIAEPVAA